MKLKLGRGLGQGWSVSCLLFNVFTNDLIIESRKITGIKPNMYADDNNTSGQ